ncbi:Chromate resistance protein ChrB [Streptomyces sp. NPDC046853]
MTAARSADRAEFLADCGKFEKEIAKALYTTGEDAS